jgi:hypothetical protein
LYFLIKLDENIKEKEKIDWKTGIRIKIKRDKKNNNNTI